MIQEDNAKDRESLRCVLVMGTATALAVDVAQTVRHQGISSKEQSGAL